MNDYSMRTADGAFLGYEQANSEKEALTVWNTRLPNGYPDSNSTPWLTGKVAVKAIETDTSDGPGHVE